MRWTLVAVLLALPACAAELQPRTVEAFDRYIRQTEQRLADSKVFLWADESGRSRFFETVTILPSDEKLCSR